MGRTTRRTAALALVLMAAGGPAFGVSPASPAPWKVLSVDVSQFPAVRITVQLPGTKDLKVGDVNLSENGNAIPQGGKHGVIVKSLSVSNGEYQSVALVMDNSKDASAAEVKQLNDAAHAFISAVPSTVPFGVVTLASKPQSLQKVVFQDQPMARRALDSIRPASTDPSLGDALVAASRTFPTRGQHNIVVFSTAGGSSGPLSADVAKAVQKADAHVWAITLGGQAGTDLTSLAGDTGGSVASATGSDMATTTDSVAHQIGDQYLLEYQSLANPGDRLDIEITILGKVLHTDATVPESVTPGFSPTPNPALFAGTHGYVLIIVILVVLLVVSSIPGRLRHRRNRMGGGGGGGRRGGGGRWRRRGGGGGGGGGRGEGGGRGGGRGRRQREGRNQR